jgi:hypothetical protein
MRGIDNMFSSPKRFVYPVAIFGERMADFVILWRCAAWLHRW